MPSWSIHLAIAKKVNEELKLNKDLFYFGNLIPDTDKNCKCGRYEAHYYNKDLPFTNCQKEKMIDLNHFIEDYKNNLANPLILGYYAHLLTENKGKRIVIVCHSTAMMYLFSSWCEVQYAGEYTFNNKVFFDGNWNYLETFKLVFKDNKLESIENVK